MNFCENCITARNKFRLKDRVILSAAGCWQMPEMIMKKSTGRVVGFGRMYDLVRILIDGQKSPQTFHARFWERI